MGKWFKRKNKNASNKVEKPKRERPTTGYEELKRESEDFVTYYKAQNLVKDEEWDEFINCLKEDLPAAFRLTGSKNHANALLNLIKEQFFNKIPISNDETLDIKPLKPVCWPWYPEGLGWQLNLTRKDIRRSEAYWKLHQFLISETETGNISRQESVSMLPPLLLDVKSHHKILDMCAAPGSKTAQIIEYLHSSLPSDQDLPSGVVVANDTDNKRCYMLTHQAKRLQSPTLMITNHDAAFMPNIHYTRNDGTVGPLKFDRILCDVPCSGDGTLRKNFDVWSKWNAVNGANLHGLQLRIARRGLEMLAVGGRMVYSTCSLNPLENEAVINRLLAEAPESVRLVQLEDQLPGLKYISGLKTWTVMNREMEICDSPENIQEKNTNLLHKHLFPPTKEENLHRNLEKCIRVLPHHQNTGGFFVAIIEKTKPLPGEKIYIENLIKKIEETTVEDVNKENVTEEENSSTELTQRTKPPPKKRRCQGFKEEPFHYMSADDEIWKNIFAFYDFNGVVDPSLFLRRTLEGKTKNLYFTNALVKDIVLNNENKLKMINTGVKVLVRCDNKGSSCDFRLAQDGSQVLFPLFTNRKIKVSKWDMIIMLLNEDADIPPQINTLHEDTQKQCLLVDSGSAIFTYIDNDPINSLDIALVGWKGRNSVRCYVVRNERIHYLRLLGADVSCFEKNKFQEQRNLLSQQKKDEDATVVPDSEKPKEDEDATVVPDSEKPKEEKDATVVPDSEKPKDDEDATVVPDSEKPKEDEKMSCEEAKDIEMDQDES